MCDRSNICLNPKDTCLSGKTCWKLNYFVKIKKKVYTIYNALKLSVTNNICKSYHITNYWRVTIEICCWVVLHFIFFKCGCI